LFFPATGKGRHGKLFFPPLIFCVVEEGDGSFFFITCAGPPRFFFFSSFLELSVFSLGRGARSTHELRGAFFFSSGGTRTRGVPLVLFFVSPYPVFSRAGLEPGQNLPFFFSLGDISKG